MANSNPTEPDGDTLFPASTPTLSILSLPTEILDRMVDFLSPNTRDLSSCALAHRTFLRLTRQRVFTTVTLQSSDALERFVALCSPPSSSSSPAIKSSIEQLKIRNLERHDWTWPSRIPVLLGSGQLTRLRELQILCSIVDLDVMFFSSLEHFVRLETLVLAGPNFMCVSELIRRISSLPALTHLTLNLDGIRWSPVPRDLISSPLNGNTRHVSPCLRLTSLSITAVDPRMSELVDWLIGTSTSVDMLWIEFWDEAVLEDVGRLISACGDALKDLTLDTCSEGVSAGALDHVDLSMNAKLSHLYLPRISFADLASVVRVLATTPSAALKHLSLRISDAHTFRTPFLEPDQSWSDLDAVLADETTSG
ncbi:hypothetical protein EIP91_002463, partial [Steccherinum ochraceum]